MRRHFVARGFVAGQRIGLAFDPDRIGACGGQRLRRRVAHFGQSLVLRGQSGAGLAGTGQRRCGGVARGFGPGHALRRVGFARQSFDLRGDPRGIGGDARQALARRCQCGLCHAPFGLDPGVLCSCGGKREFGAAAVGFGAVARGSRMGAYVLFVFQRGLGRGQICAQPGVCLGCVARITVGQITVVGNPRGLAVDGGQAILRGLQLQCQAGHALGVGGHVLPPVEHGFARLRQCRGGGVLCRLGSLCVAARGTFVGFGLRQGGFGGGCGGGGVAPAGKDERCLGNADAFGQRGIAVGGAGLATQGANARFEARDQIVQPTEIGFGRAQPHFGFAAPDVEAGDARCILQHHAAFGGFGGDDRRDAALADQRGAVRAGRGIGEYQRDIARAHVVAVQAIDAAGAAFDAAGDFHFGIIRA